MSATWKVTFFSETPPCCPCLQEQLPVKAINSPQISKGITGFNTNTSIAQCHHDCLMLICQLGSDLLDF